VFVSAPLRRFTTSALWILAAAVVVCADGSSLDTLRLDDVAGHHVAPFAARDAKALVFLFTRTDCPISNRYAPEIERLYEKFGPDAVTFWLVYCDPGESSEAIRDHLTAYGYRMGALRDPQHLLVGMVGARVTPEAAVFVPEPQGWRMLYRGRIDDRYVTLGRMRPAPTTHDLERVLEAIVRGSPPETTTTTAIGCFISDLK
jgi:hypothetical protein